MHNSLVKKIVKRSEYPWGKVGKETGRTSCLKNAAKEFFRQGYYAARILVQEERLRKISHIGCNEKLVAYSRTANGTVDQWLGKYFGEGTTLSDVT